MNEKNVVVTGATSGVGKSIALRLSASGMRIFAFARHKDRLQALQTRSKSDIIGIPVDVRLPEQIKAAYQTIESNYGPIDILINNAGIYQRREFSTQDLDVVERIIDTNLKGTLYCTRLVLPYMLQRKVGRIINIASVAGTRGIPGEAAYCASKHGIIGFADTVAQEVLPQGILVTTLCPGGIDTPLWRSGDSPYPGDLDKLMRSEEIAELVEFLLRQPKRTLYKRLIFFPTQEWH